MSANVNDGTSWVLKAEYAQKIWDGLRESNRLFITMDWCDNISLRGSIRFLAHYKYKDIGIQLRINNSERKRLIQKILANYKIE